MPERMKPYFLSAFLLFLFVYLGVQALTGERGLLSGASRDTMLQQRQVQLTALTERRADLEMRARYLRTGNLSRDLLEERAMAVLGFADPRDYVIRAASAPSPSRSLTTS